MKICFLLIILGFFQVLANPEKVTSALKVTDENVLEREVEIKKYNTSCLPPFHFSVKWNNVFDCFGKKWNCIGVMPSFISWKIGEIYMQGANKVQEEAYNDWLFRKITKISSSKYIQQMFDTLSFHQEALKSDFCRNVYLTEEYEKDDKYPTPFDSDCKKCKKVFNIFSYPSGTWEEWLKLDLINYLKGKNFCGNLDYFSDFYERYVCSVNKQTKGGPPTNLVNKIVPKIMDWFQGYMNGIGKSKSAIAKFCQKYC